MEPLAAHCSGGDPCRDPLSASGTAPPAFETRQVQTLSSPSCTQGMGRHSSVLGMISELGTAGSVCHVCAIPSRDTARGDLTSRAGDT